jgi:hypothetical protein
LNRYVGNLPPMPGVFPDYPAPVASNAGAEREMVTMRWMIIMVQHRSLRKDSASCRGQRMCAHCPIAPCLIWAEAVVKM